MVATACGPTAKRLRGGGDARPPLPTLTLPTLPRCGSACACTSIPGCQAMHCLTMSCPPLPIVNTLALPAVPKIGKTSHDIMQCWSA